MIREAFHDAFAAEPFDLQLDALYRLDVVEAIAALELQGRTRWQATVAVCRRHDLHLLDALAWLRSCELATSAIERLVNLLPTPTTHHQQEN